MNAPLAATAYFEHDAHRDCYQDFRSIESTFRFSGGKFSLLVKDKNMLEDIALLTDKQTELFNVMDAYLRDYSTSKAYVKK